jgi:hypothetical protein
MWQGWILGILGIWVIIEPYFAMTDASNKIVLVITGIIIAVLGFWTAYSERSM